MAEKTKFHVDISSVHKEVTGSCILNTIKFPDGSTKKILIDCGMFQERDYIELNKSFPFIAEDIDHVIITHNHMDHIGRIPLLVKQGYHGKIHMSKATSALIKPALYDGLKILQNRFELFNEPLLYTDEDVTNSIELIEEHDYEKSEWLDKNIKLTLFMNGHLPGAAIVLLQIGYRDIERKQDTINLLFTGDYIDRNSFFTVKPLPNWVYDLPITIVQESTYGDMNSSEVEYVFNENIKAAVESKKQIICPVFSLARSQEIMLTLRRMQDENQISKNIPIYYDGKLGCKYNLLYESNALDLNENSKQFYPDNFTIIDNKQKRSSVIADNNCKIILSTSGMGTYGPSRTYLPALLTKSNALIHFTGYLAEDSMGRTIYEAEPGAIVEMMGLQVKKRAEVKYTSEFSSHAKADELINFLRPFKDIKMVLINHGEANTKIAYSQRVVDEIEPKYTAILGDYLYRVSAYGFVKSISTKYQQVK